MRTHKLKVIPMLLLLAYSQAHAVTVWYQPTPYPLNINSGVHVWSGWFNNSFNLNLVQDDKLQIGGWGDTYTSPLKFDLKGLPPTSTNAILYLHAIPSGAAGSSQVSIWPITSDWTPSVIGWNNFPSTSSGYYWNVSTAVNTWRGYGITNWYNEWKSGARPDKGMIIWPYNNDGTQRFDKFVSTRSTDDGKRPILQIDFTPPVVVPNFKMPLPGNVRWLVTTEIGGWDCKGLEALSHQGNNYFAIDFSWRTANLVYANPDPTGNKLNNRIYIPVIAAAGGKVLDSLPTSANGHNVVLDHDGDGDINTGFQSLYLHLQPPGPSVVKNQVVQQGDLLGYMGNTGQSSAPHLHSSIRYQNNGTENTHVRYAVMDNWILKSFQTECSSSDYIRYYMSSNRTY